MARVKIANQLRGSFPPLLLILAVAAIFGCQARPTSEGSPSRATRDSGETVDPQLWAAFDGLGPAEQLPVIVRLADQVNVAAIRDDDRSVRLRRVIEALQTTAKGSQHSLRALLEAQYQQGTVADITSLWIFNGLALKASRAVVQELAERPEVSRISLDWSVRLLPLAAPDPQPASLPAGNLNVINVPVLWSLGFRGQGVIVATMDTGVDVSHPDLAPRWRGGSNSWFDPYGEHPDMPTDRDGHGTWTAGVLVAGNLSGADLGVAPEAKWISVKIRNDQGVFTASAIHRGFQWLLDPDANPATPDAPRVVSNSWSFSNPGCNLEFQADLQALKAAGILPIFSAGNSGPTAFTSFSPANYPEVLAVGASDNADIIYNFSSRGPSLCGEPETQYPDLVAPGVGVRTTDLFGTYRTVTGTSFAAPHVAGVAALLLNAFPNLTIDQLEAALLFSAKDLGPVGRDNDFGYGRIDASAAYLWVLNQDSDNDGFSDSIEVLVGTDRLKPCANTATPDDEVDDRWPPDFNDDQIVNILDRAALVLQLKTREYNPRYDLNGDGALNIFDRAILVKSIGRFCVPR